MTMGHGDLQRLPAPALRPSCRRCTEHIDEDARLAGDVELVRFQLAFGDRDTPWPLDQRLLLADLRRQQRRSAGESSA